MAQLWKRIAKKYRRRAVDNSIFRDKSIRAHSAANAKLRAELATAKENADELSKALDMAISERDWAMDQHEKLSKAAASVDIPTPHLVLMGIFRRLDNGGYKYHPRSGIYEAIDTERAYQDRKYGCPQDRRLGLVDYLHIAQGELNEAMCAVADGDPQHALLELLQVVAVGVAALEQHGVVERGEESCQAIQS